MEEKTIWKQIDDDMQRGYAKTNNDLGTCREWGKVWDAVLDIMRAGTYQSLEEFDKHFDGMQCLYNWASDYEMALANATHEDISFAKQRIDFCNGYLQYIFEKDDINTLNMRRAIAESYFRLGKEDEGESVFKALTEEYPRWAWGWIGWSDEYNLYSDFKNYDKAIEILNKALEIEGIDEKHEIKSRLRGIYESCGRLDEAAAIVIDDWDYGVPLSELPNIGKNAKTIINDAVKNVVRNIKIGRNEPCPCNSGKKYKRCCGNK